MSTQDVAPEVRLGVARAESPAADRAARHLASLSLLLEASPQPPFISFTTLYEERGVVVIDPARYRGYLLGLTSQPLPAARLCGLSVVETDELPGEDEPEPATQQPYPGRLRIAHVPLADIHEVALETSGTQNL